jgi:hypothetical protein
MMGALVGWMRRHRIAAGFAAGVLVTLAAAGAVGYLVLADQRRSGRVLAVALTQALGREVRIERVTGLGPSRVVLRGVRLPVERGWPADIAVDSVEASGPLLAAARGEAAPIRLVVTRPTITPPATAGAGGAALESLRQGLGGLLGSSALVDVTLTGGALELPGAARESVAFDMTLRKGRDEARAELVLHAGSGAPLTVRLAARPEGERIRIGVDGVGPLRPLGAWLPAGLVRAADAAPLGFQLALAIEPGDRLAGRGGVRLGDRAALDAELALTGSLLRLTGLHGVADLELAAEAAGLAGAPPRGQLEVVDGEVAWRPGTAPSARATLRVPQATLPPGAAGVDLVVQGLETRLLLEPTEAGAVASGDLRLARVLVAGIEIAPVATTLRAAVSAGGALSRAELTGLTARLLGAPVRASATYDGARARADARLEAEALPIDAVVRRLFPGWLASADRLRTGPVRIAVADLALRDLGAGRVETEVHALGLRRPDGEAELAALRLRFALRRGGVSVGAEALRARGTLPLFEGQVPRLKGDVELARDGVAATLISATLVGLDEEGREMFSADLARRPGAAPAGPVRLVARAPALDRLGGLWPSLDRQARGSAVLEVEAPDVRFATFDGRLALRVPEAELLRGRVSVREVDADVPVSRGRPPATAGGAAGGRLRTGELIGYGVVVHDLAGGARLVDDRLALTDLRYALYSGEGHGAGEAGLAADGPFARLRLAGDGVRLEEFIAGYGIRGGTMTGVLRYDLDVRYGAGRLAADGRLAVPDGGTVTIELLDRLLQYTQADPSGVARRALENLRAFDYKSADVLVRTAGDVRVTVSLRGRERFGIFPPRVREINVVDMPLSFLARQFPGR